MGAIPNVIQKDFVMHAELLRSVIKKQAGSLAKALLEGVMNSVDAEATFVKVTISANECQIEDDGRGFQSRQEVEDFFATFGQPHEEGDAIYGRFRMGRGQMFAFGVNVWRTGTFQMDVDIDTRLGFDWHTDLPDEKGCNINIDLYEPLSQRDIYEITQEITKMVKYVSIPVEINGVVVSKTPTEKAFPDSTEDAYIKVTENGYGLDVYNLGVFVCTIPSWQYGISGTVVAKKQLDVNFARNQVLNSCPVWKRIKAVVDHKGQSEVRTKTTLSDHERANVIKRLVSGDMRPSEVAKMKIFTDVTGKAWSLAQINRKFKAFTVAPMHNLLADKLMQQDMAFCLAQGTLDQFGCEAQELFATFFPHSTAPKYVPLETLTRGMDASCTPIPKAKWTPSEKVWISLFQRVYYSLQQFDYHRAYEETKHLPYPEREEAVRKMRDSHKDGRRDIRIGSSKTMLAWTDGASHITFSREYLATLKLMHHGQPFARDMVNAFLTLVHEYCHDTDSRENIHSPEFYQEYHDLTHRHIPTMLSNGLGYLTPAKYKQLIEKYRKGQPEEADYADAPAE